MWFSEAVWRRTSGGRGSAKSAAGQYDAYTNLCAIQLAFVHVCYRSLGGFGGCVKDVSGSAVCVEGFVKRHVQVGDHAVGAEDLAEMGGSDVLGQFLNDDLRRVVSYFCASRKALSHF